MAINKDWLRNYIYVALDVGQLDKSEDAIELLMLTAAQESHLGTYLTQVNGPALGIFQMEPATFYDTRDRYFIPKVGDDYIYDEPEILIASLNEAILYARAKYLLVPEPLPSKDSVVDMARYYKKYWNTKLGKATVREAVQNYNRFCL
jgi:hypothetical protein